jgi:Plasmid pRiA4b ORF-3-like protein
MSDLDNLYLFGPTVHTLRVSMRDITPEVWRRLRIRSDMPLPKLARVLEQAMGWYGHHLHMFDVRGLLFGVPDEDAEYMINEKVATVKHVLPKIGNTLRWDYDFGDGWEHDVVAVAIDAASEGNLRTLCLDGERACPPEDCGGVSGYERLLDVLANPKHPEHAAVVDWAPAGFDPAAFDLVAVNRRLRVR